MSWTTVKEAFIEIFDSQVGDLIGGAIGAAISNGIDPFKKLFPTLPEWLTQALSTAVGFILFAFVFNIIRKLIFGDSRKSG